MGPPRVSTDGGYAAPGRSPSGELPSLDQGAVWHSSVHMTHSSADERYALFTPDEIFSESSVNLRRIDVEAFGMQFDDAYAALVARQDQWYLDRRDINQPHSSDWPSLSPDFWCSSDSGKICFLPLSECSSMSSRSSFPGAGQYHKAVGDEWRCHAPLTSPGNVGGFHSCCVDTLQPGSQWILVARLADFGSVLDRSAGVRVEFAALVRSDSESLVASLGQHDECRALFRVANVTLPTGKVVLSDPADAHYFAGPTAATSHSSSADLPSSEDCVEDGPCVPSGLGAGFYPVILSRDPAQKICRISVVFHPTRASKISQTFPPSRAQRPATHPKPPLAPSQRSRSKDATLLV